MEAPDRTTENFKHAAIECDNAIPVYFDLEQVHSAERIRFR